MRKAVQWCNLQSSNLCIDLESEDAEDDSPVLPIQFADPFVESTDPFQPFYVAEALPVQNALFEHTCDKYDQNHPSAEYPWFSGSRVDHIDSNSRGQGPHMLQTEIVRLPNMFWKIDGALFKQGSASVRGHNCLIDTFRQLLGDFPDNTVASIRTSLQRERPQEIKENNFLDIEAIWQHIVRAYHKDPGTYTIYNLSAQFLGNGDVYGHGGHKLYILNHGNAHFEPLWPQES